MSSISSNSSKGMVSNSSSQNPPPDRDRYRTCCDICHIKTGTVFLGMLEMAILVGMLYGIVQQLVWKSATYTRGACDSTILRDCLLLEFSHFSLTLIFDYIIALLLVVVLFSILLMFCGIFSDTSCLLFPHLFVQSIFLLFSVGYFVLYAWSYFYGDLYSQNRSFEVQSFIERMWLASLLLILASFQVYLFFAVLKCSLYLAKVDYSRRERETAFERLSERVRIAKENGLWRQSGVGGFLSYTRQEEDERKKREKKIKGLGKQVGHVQWSNENKVVVLEEDASRSDAAPLPPPLYRPTVQFMQQQQKIVGYGTAVRDSTQSSDLRRQSGESREEAREAKGRTPSLVSQSQPTANPRLGQFSSQKDRDRHAHFQLVKRSESGGPQQRPPEKGARTRGDFPVKIPLDDESYIPATPPSPVRRKSSREEKLREASHQAIANEKARREKEREQQREGEKARTSSSSSPEKECRERTSSSAKATGGKRSDKREKAYLNAEGAGPSTPEHKNSPSTQPHHHHSHHHSNSHPSTSRGDEEARQPEAETAESRRKGPRALRKLRSVDSSEYDVPEDVFERRMKSRRRSSDAGRAADLQQEERPTPSHKHHKRERESTGGGPPTSAERKPHDGLYVKKISISASVSPFA